MKKKLMFWKVTDTKSYIFKKYTMKSEETRIHARGPDQESIFFPLYWSINNLENGPQPGKDLSEQIDLFWKCIFVRKHR